MTDNTRPTPGRLLRQRMNRLERLAGDHPAGTDPAEQHAWPRPGDDQPRLDWPSYLRHHAANYTRGGQAGRLIAARLEDMALEAEALGAWSPEEHEQRLAEAERDDEESAWQAALDTTWADYEPHSRWTTDEPGGVLAGHPADEPVACTCEDD